MAAARARSPSSTTSTAADVDVLDFLVDPLRSGIDRRALLELALVGGFCGALGFWVVTERLAYSAESLSHGLLPGLVLAALAAAPLLLGAAGGALMAAALIAFAARDPRIGPDTGTAVAVSGLVGLGALLALAPDSPQRLEELLFGDPLGVTDSDLAAAAILLALGGVALVALHRPLSAVAFDASGAAAAGLRPALLRLVLLVLLAAAVAVAVQGLGALLVLAVLIGPPLAVRHHARTPARAMLGGAAVAVLAGIVGIGVSYHAHSAAGASVALALCAAAALGSALRPSPGWARRRAWPRSRRRARALPGR
jgi:ABC-type Mn2+/Zn2+ transport system permease subunit